MGMRKGAAVDAANGRSAVAWPKCMRYLHVFACMYYIVCRLTSVSTPVVRRKEVGSSTSSTHLPDEIV
jgi:hypothetical protein